MYKYSDQYTITKLNRKPIYIVLILFINVTSIYSTVVNGYTHVVENNDSNYVCNLLLSVDDGSSTLGNAVIRYTYDVEHLCFPPNPKEGIDYFFHSCDSCDYLTSITQPSEGKLSINIACLSGNGATISIDLFSIVAVIFKVVAPIDDIILQPELRQFFSPLSSTQWDLGNWDEILLPITISSFTASCVEEKVKLNWETASEINNYGFEIFRTDTTEIWKMIGFVPGYGTSYSLNTYSFVDEDTLCGNIRYRIKQIDNNGIYEYSSISEVFIEATEGLDFDLSSFMASCSCGMVMLNWETSSEKNVYGYDVLRTDTTENWETIGFVPSQGNNDSATTYSFIDEDSLCGNIRYRIKQIDSLGLFEYSYVSEVFIEVTTGIDYIHEKIQYSLNQNYPNPFNPSTKISYSIPEIGNVELKIFDLLGREVITLVNKEQKPGNYEVIFDAHELASGVYLSHLQAGNFREVRKMILVK